MRHSPYFSALENTPSQVLVVKSIQTHASQLFDVRMQTSQSSRHTYHSKDAFGGFEIRHKDWQSVSARNNERTKQGWDSLTVYVVSL